MTLVQMTLSGLEIIWSRLTGRPVPVAVRWNLLNRCACRCAYCSLWKTESKEIPFDGVREILRQFQRLGTRQISYSGGEPLLREDIGKIISETARLGIAPTMNSSGYGLKRHVEELKDLDLLKISLDGPREIHDLVRNRNGAYDTAIEAAEIASRRLRAFSFSTTISRYNVNHLSFLLDLAERHDSTVTFQPLKKLYRGIESMGDIAPESGELLTAVQMLIDQKMAGNKRILNSIPELRRMKAWPSFPPVRCTAGKVFVMVNPDGTLLPCDRIEYSSPLPNITQTPVAEAIKLLPEVRCAGCAFTGSQQLNMLYNLDITPLAEVFRLSK